MGAIGRFSPMNRIGTRSFVVAGGLAVLLATAGCTAKTSVKASSNTKTSISMVADTGAGIGRDGGPGRGTPLTGADYDAAVKAALAKYPGTVERAERRDDGTIEVHVTTSNGEVHVLEDKNFVVTGVDQGGPGGPGGGQPPTTA